MSLAIFLIMRAEEAIDQSGVSSAFKESSSSVAQKAKISFAANGSRR
jgi:hypothetical protein